MSIQKIDHTLSDDELSKLLEYFPDYIKLVADLQNKILYGGSEFHADSADILINQGSVQQFVWGGGVDLKSKLIDCRAVYNIRPENRSLEILDHSLRNQFINLVKNFFPEFNE